ncbi:CIR protein [Plasmodium chabaudi chabaudi]|uniref:CIR protein n=1 Tax=Plasmodium chabaudi chabaudi TaxID=31271 RepID=A0A4V0K639_PLACU|nr:CIR protein [Plasmodium chabaudi chabaudi]VTZ67860.1 CIR protein [Plasmodium chabaudi chabaudi]|eukprot:XP_016654391.1 CIR protein [Plasmodium chabaudi chabaudi]
MSYKQTCDIFREVDELFDGKSIDVDNFNAFSSLYNEYCPVKNGSKSCDTEYERIAAVAGYIFMNFILDNSINLHSDDDRHLEYFIIWISNILYKIAPTHLESLGESYEKHLSKSVGNFVFWNLLYNKRHLFDGNISILSIFYILFKQMCETFDIYNKRGISGHEYAINAAQSYIIYNELSKFVNQCGPYRGLLDHLKTIYNDFRQTAIRENAHNKHIFDQILEFPSIDKTKYGSEFESLECKQVHDKLIKNLPRLVKKENGELNYYEESQKEENKLSTVMILLGSDDDDSGDGDSGDDDNLGNYDDILKKLFSQIENIQQGKSPVSGPQQAPEPAKLIAAKLVAAKRATTKPKAKKDATPSKAQQPKQQPSTNLSSTEHETSKTPKTNTASGTSETGSTGTKVSTAQTPSQPEKPVPAQAAAAQPAAAQPAPAQTAPAQTAPAQTVSVKPAPPQTAAAKPAPPQTAPVKPAPPQTAAAKPAPPQTAAAKPAPPQTAAAKPAPAKPVPPQTAAAKPDPAKPDPAKPAPAKPAPAKPAPAKPVPPQTAPVKPAPVKPAPVKPAPAQQSATLSSTESETSKTHGKNEIHGKSKNAEKNETSEKSITQSSSTKEVLDQPQRQPPPRPNTSETGKLARSEASPQPPPAKPASIQPLSKTLSLITPGAIPTTSTGITSTHTKKSMGVTTSIPILTSTPTITKRAKQELEKLAFEKPTLTQSTYVKPGPSPRPPATQPLEQSPKTFPSKTPGTGKTSSTSATTPTITKTSKSTTLSAPTTTPTGETTSITSSSIKSTLTVQNDDSKQVGRGKRSTDSRDLTIIIPTGSRDAGGQSSRQDITQENSGSSSSLSHQSQVTNGKIKIQPSKSKDQEIQSKNESDKSPGAQNGVGSTQDNPDTVRKTNPSSDIANQLQSSIPKHGDTGGGLGSSGGESPNNTLKKTDNVDKSPPGSKPPSQAMKSGDQRNENVTVPSVQNSGNGVPNGIDNGARDTKNNAGSGKSGEGNSNGVTVNNEEDENKKIVQNQGTYNKQGSSSSGSVDTNGGTGVSGSITGGKDANKGSSGGGSGVSSNGSNSLGSGINTDKQPQKVSPSPTSQASSSSLHLSPLPVTSSPSATPSITLSFSVPGTTTTASITTTLSTGEKAKSDISSIESELSGQNGGSKKLTRARRSTVSASSINTPTNESGTTSDTSPSIKTVTDVKINEKTSIWCIGSNKKFNIIGIGIIGISIFVFLAFLYKYLPFGSRKKSKKKKITKKVINLVDGRKMEKTFIKSIDRGKKSNIIINSGDNKKIAKIIINSDDTNKPIKTEINSRDEKRKTHITINSEHAKKYTKSVINSSDRKKRKIIVNSVNEKMPLLNIYKLMKADPIPFINLFFLLIFFVYKRKQDTI